MSLALVIAVRYCAVRKQFGPTKENEWPVIEYQTQVRTSRFLFQTRLTKQKLYKRITCYVFNILAMAIIASLGRSVCDKIVCK